MALAYKKSIIFVSVLLVVLSRNCLLAQSSGGYNYGPPTDVTNTANIQSKATTPALRPIVAAFPTGSTSVGIVPNFPTVATGFAGTPNVFNTAYGAGQRATGAGVTGQGTGLAYTPTATAGSLATNTGVYAVSGQTTAGGLNRNTNTLQQQRGNDVGIYRGSSTNVGLTRDSSGTIGLEQDYDGDFSAIPGLPGVNYPVYSQVPQTNFDCAQQPLPGYYSDVEAQCQVFHICALNRTYSFLCPNGTIFSQETLVCVWWNQFECASAPPLYPNNAFIYDYGNDRAASANVGYSQTSTSPQLTAGSSNRQQGNFQLASTSRTPTASIYGASNIRTTVGSSSFASPVQASGFTSTGGNVQMTGGRFIATPTGATQTFPTGTPVSPAALPFGAVLRGGGPETNVQKDTRFGGLQEVAYANAPITSSSTNREYLPPGRP